MPRFGPDPRFRDVDPAPVLLAVALTAGALVQLLLPLPPLPAPALGTAGRGGTAHRSSVAFGVAAAPATPAYPEIVARPLFSPTRSAAETAAAAPSGSFTLVGVASGGGAAVATLRTAAGETRTVRVGEGLDGWRLIAVGRGRAVLDRDGALQSLRLGEAPPVAAAVSSPPDPEPR